MNDRRIDRLIADYLDALDRGDFDAIDSVWEQSATAPELEQALHEVHAALDAADRQAIADVAADAIAAKVEQHLPSAEVVRPTTSPVTVADVADELFRHPPERLPPQAHALNAALRSARDPLPEDLALSRLTIWAEEKYGMGPVEYWRAFRRAAVKLELRRAADAEYYLAARRTPRPENRP